MVAAVMAFPGLVMHYKGDTADAPAGVIDINVAPDYGASGSDGAGGYGADIYGGEPSSDPTQGGSAADEEDPGKLFR